MAISLSGAYDSKLRKPFPKPLMLKDHLRDDLSSCSSNGFRSFPRRQCCTTVRFLLQMDRAKNKQSHKKQQLLRSRSKAASSATLSVLQRASEAVINAVKKLPFATVVPPSSTKPKKAILPRSFSRKFSRRSFWKKTDREEIKRRKSFHELLGEKPWPSEFSPPTSTTITTTDSNSLTSGESNSNSKGNSWSDSEFTASNYLQSSRGNSTANDVAERKSLSPEKMVSERVGATFGDGSPDVTIAKSTKKVWLNEEKEQFSPISVLDFPFDDDDDVSSPLEHRILIKGTKQKLTQKIGRYQSLDRLEPVDLEKRIALSESDPESESVDSSLLQPSSMSTQDHLKEEECRTEQKAAELFKQMNATNSSVSFKLNADNLLLDFFIEKNTFDSEVLDEAMHWMSGQPRELFLGWELQKNRQAYVRGMEMGGKWDNLDEEKQEFAMELEAEVFTSLVNELLLDL